MKLNPFSKKSNPYLDKVKAEHDTLNQEVTPLKAELAEAEAEHAAAREKQTRLRDAAGSLSMNTPPAAKAHWPILCEANQRMERLKSKVSNLESQVFKSLSAAARHITGTQWNGPKFFGLRDGKGDGQ